MKILWEETTFFTLFLLYLYFKKRKTFDRSLQKSQSIKTFKKDHELYVSNVVKSYVWNLLMENDRVTIRVDNYLQRSEGAKIPINWRHVLKIQFCYGL